MLNIAYTAVLSHTLLFATQGTLAQALLSMGISKQKYRSGLLFPSPGGLPDPVIEPASPVSPAFIAARFFTAEHWGSPSFVLPTINTYLDIL